MTGLSLTDKEGDVGGGEAGGGGHGGEGYGANDVVVARPMLWGTCGRWCGKVMKQRNTTKQCKERNNTTEIIT